MHSSNWSQRSHNAHEKLPKQTKPLLKARHCFACDWDLARVSMKAVAFIGAVGGRNPKVYTTIASNTQIVSKWGLKEWNEL